MKKVKNINIKFFQKYKKIILVNSILTVGTIGGFMAYKKSDNQNFDYTRSGLERVVDSCAKYDPQGTDRLVWEEKETNKEVKIFNMSFSPSNIWNIRIFRGMAESTHYRIEEENINDDSNEYSKWQEIPSNNLITVTRQTLPKAIQYDKQLNIRFGKYDEKTNTIIKENAECFEWEKSSQEEVKKFDIARERIKLIAEHLVNENDQTVEKVKKIYDYLIEHTEYRWDPELKGITSLSIFNKYYMDCAGYTEFMNIALNHIGIESFTAMDSTHGHIWNIVNIDGKYYHLDATYSDTSSWENTSKYNYFLVSDSYMLADHRYFVSEKEVVCNEIYDLTGIVPQQEIEFRELKYKEKSFPKDSLLGDIKESAYNLPFRSK